MKQETKRLSVNLDKQFFLRLRILAAQRDMTISEIVRMSLVRYANEVQRYQERLNNKK